MFISELNIYPVKSCRGSALLSAKVDALGLVGDRRAMLVDENAQFISLRSHPKMAGIKPFFEGDRLFLDLDGDILETHDSGNRVDAKVWKDTVNVSLSTDTVSAKLSRFMGETVRLVFMDAETTRRVEPKWANARLSLADGAPISITNTASLAELAATSNSKIDMAQFRPNITIKSDEPWAEDHWKTIRIGDVTFDMIKPINRCKIVTLDPNTGQQSQDRTMEALIKSRRSGDKRVKGVLFAWAAVARGCGKLNVGDDVQVVETREPWAIM